MKGGNPTLSIVDKKDFDVSIKTNINGENIIEFTVNGCNIYFSRIPLRTLYSSV